MTDEITWQLPTDRLLVVVYGSSRQFEIEGLCIAQGSAGFIMEASPESDTFAGLDVKAQFIPYSSVISVRLLESGSAGGVRARREKEKTRRHRVRGELEDLLGGPWQQPADSEPEPPAPASESTDGEEEASP